MVKIIFVYVIAFWSGAVGGSLPCLYIFRITAAFWMSLGYQWEPFPCTGPSQHCSAGPSKAGTSACCLGRAAWGGHKGIIVTCYRWWSLVQKQRTTALPEPADGGVLALWESVSHGVFSEWNLLAHKWVGLLPVREALGFCWAWHRFPSSTSASTACSSGMFFMQDKNFPVLAHGFSVLHVAQICTDLLSI